jgi:hypothetical protein
MDLPNYLLYVQHHVQISKGSRWMSLTISYTHNVMYKSVRGSWLTSITISYTFYMWITANEKQGASDRCSIQLLLLSARASPCIKSKGSISMCSRFSIWLTKFSKVFQLSKYYHWCFGLTPNPVSVSPIIHRNTREQMSTRSSSIMIGHIDPDQLISFIGWQRINRLHIIMEELIREDLPPTISTRIQDFCIWYI